MEDITKTNFDGCRQTFQGIFFEVIKLRNSVEKLFNLEKGRVFNWIALIIAAVFFVLCFIFVSTGSEKEVAASGWFSGAGCLFFLFVSFSLLNRYQKRQEELRDGKKRLIQLIDELELWKKRMEDCVRGETEIEVKILVFGKPIFEGDLKGPNSPMESEGVQKVLVDMFLEKMKKFSNIKKDMTKYFPL